MARAALALFVILAGTALAPLAGAAQPERVPLPDFNFSLPAAVCGFPVQTETVANNEVATIFPDGRVIVTGTLKVRVTNVSQPSHSLLLNISGPTLIKADGTFTATGTWLWAQEPNPLAPHGMLVLTSGNVVPTFGADPTTFTLDVRGRIIDLCPALA